MSQGGCILSFDWSRFGSAPVSSGEVDPVRLFRTLTVLDGSINDLWLGQGDALRRWHEVREREDVALVLNTGAGKTLVGLLVAQSLVNETRGEVVYVTASIQLVEQTAAKAADYGLEVSTYVRGEFNNTVFQQGRGPCITTYQALFNGLTRKWDGIKAAVFDDAHAATSIIRSQFTLDLGRDRFPAVHAAVTAAYAEHLRTVGSGDLALREAVTNDDPRPRWFVPPGTVRRHWGSISTALVEGAVAQDDFQKYAWGYLGPKLHLCATFLSATSVSFTPVVVPVRTLPYFRRGIRRVYLSATLAADDAFLRTFGKIPDEIVSPDTPAGKCERMIVMPRLVQGIEDDVAAAKTTVASEKALILVPTRRESQDWQDVADGSLGSEAASQVENFKVAAPPAKLCLVGRYDGVDLPGDTCRMMVLHGLPSGLGPLERFMWEHLAITNVLRSTVASRVVQSFGRISRGMTDHGVVIITGSALVDWLLRPANQQALPAFLRRQIEVGSTISKQVGPGELVGLARQCLDQDPGWKSFYASQMGGVDLGPDAESDVELADAAAVEVRFGESLWNEEFEAAVQAIHAGRSSLSKASDGLAAWYLHWSGFVHELLGDAEGADDLYRDSRRAHRAMPAVLRQEVRGEPDGPDEEQVQEIVQFMSGGRNVLAKFDVETAALDGASPGQMEEAARCLGSYLGLDSSRPDKSEGTGPDVLWMLTGKVAWSLELKTGKKVAATGTYSKRHVAKAGADDPNWVQTNKTVSAVVPAIVGPHRPADSRANPAPGLRVVEPHELVKLRVRVRSAIENLLAARPAPLFLPNEVRRVFGEAGLLWSCLSQQALGPLLADLR